MPAGRASSPIKSLCSAPTRCVRYSSRVPNPTASAASFVLPPGLGLQPAGYANRVAGLSSVHSDIEINALLLGVKESKVLLLTFDYLYIGVALRKAVEAALEGVLRPDQVFIAASHTHSAPQVDETKPSLGAFEPSYLAEVIAVVRPFLRNLLRQVPEEVTVEAGQRRHRSGIKRRRLKVTRQGIDTIMGPSRLPKPNLEIRRVRVKALRDSRVLAEVWSTPIHPTSFFETQSVSSDYPGEVRRQVRSSVGSEIPVLFFQGFSGDIRPDTPTITRGDEIRFGRFNHQQWQDWCDELFITFGRIQLKPLHISEAFVWRETLPVSDYFSGEIPVSEGHLHVISLGKKWGLVGFPFEMSHAWGRKISRKVPFGAWKVSCIDHVFGYFPLNTQRFFGGYEPKQSWRHFGIDGIKFHAFRNIKKAVTSSAARCKRRGRK